MNLRKPFVGYLRRLCTQSSPVLIVSKQPKTYEEEGVCQWILNRPQAKNALSAELIGLLQQSIISCNADRELRCLLITSTVPGVFCAGADLKERIKMSVEEASDAVKRLQMTFDEISRIRCPTIAVVDGAALGGGAELAIACDLRIGSPSAKFAFPETKLGIIPGAGGTQRLPRLVGLAKAKELIFTGKAINSKESLALGLLNSISDSPLEAALQMSREICSASPSGVQLAKSAINEGIDKPIQEALDIESHYYNKTLMTEDRHEGLKAFREKRKPIFKGF